MIAGQPGSQKSSFALWWVASMNLPTLYFSADMASHTAITRLAATITGDAVEEVAEGLAGAGDAFYADALSSSKVRFCFDPNPTLDTIYGELEAWVELADAYPSVIVIDNLMDVLADGDGELQAQRAVLLEAKTLARETGAAVVILHHMSEQAGHPEMPAARRHIQNKLAQTPELILSVALDVDEFKVSVVKHRNGRQDASAQQFIRLRSRPERNRFEKWVAMPGFVPQARPWEEED